MCSSQNFIRKNRFPTPNLVNILNSVNIRKKIDNSEMFLVEHLKSGFDTTALPS